MREHGSVATARGLGADSHVCWAFEDERGFRSAALDFLSDGMRLGQRLMYITNESSQRQHEDLEPLGDVEKLISDGSLELHLLSELYPIGQPIDAPVQIAIYDQALNRALAEGYAGLRVAAQTTDLAGPPATWDGLVHWECAADHYIASHPVAALCGYDSAVVPDGLLGDIAAVHPCVHGASRLAAFRLFYADSGVVMLEGEIDLSSTSALDRVLRLTLSEDKALSLDLGRLGFIDHNGLYTLASHTGGSLDEEKFTVRGIPRHVRRLCELVEIEL